jgi:GT2 family glycosyltransferase
MRDPAGIAVVIPTYRGADMTISCLRSLRNAVARVDGHVEVIVVDDGSGDGSGSRIRAEHPWVRVYERPVNGGYPAAVNAGLRATTAPWVLTLNNDTTVDADVLVELLRVARAAASDVGALAAQQRFSERPDTIYSAGITLDWLAINADRLIGMPLSASEDEPTEVFGACGGAAVYSRRLMDDIGLLDESFRFGLEDADFAWRARMAGWRCLYVPRAVVFHDVGGTVPYGSEFRFFQAGRNRLRLLIKNADRRMLIRYGPRMLIYDLAYVSAAAIRHRTVAPILGRWESLRSWRAIRRSGARGRRPVELARVMGLRAALVRRSNLIRR